MIVLVFWVQTWKSDCDYLSYYDLHGYKEEEEEEESLLWQNKCALYTIIIQSIDMIGLATETPIKTCNNVASMGATI